MNLTYNFEKQLEAHEVAGVFRKSGINRPVDDLDRIQRMIGHADLILTARMDGRLVGIARAITDFSYCCYLSDLAVDSDYQKNGIGKALIHKLQERLGEEVTLILVSAPTAVDYYPRIGFEKLDKAFSIRRKK